MKKHTQLLLRECYHQSTSDYSLFTLQHMDHFTYLLVYVYDIVIVGTPLEEFTRIKGILDTNFKIKDLGTLKYFLASKWLTHKQASTFPKESTTQIFLPHLGSIYQNLQAHPLILLQKFIKIITNLLKIFQLIEDSLASSYISILLDLISLLRLKNKAKNGRSIKKWYAIKKSNKPIEKSCIHF